MGHMLHYAADPQYSLKTALVHWQNIFKSKMSLTVFIYSFFDLVFPFFPDFYEKDKLFYFLKMRFYLDFSVYTIYTLRINKRPINA